MKLPAIMADDNFDYQKFRQHMTRLAGMLFVSALILTVALGVSGHRVGIDVGGLPLVLCLLAANASTARFRMDREDALVVRCERLQAQVDMLRLHKGISHTPAAGTSVNLITGDTLNLRDANGSPIAVFEALTNCSLRRTQ